MPVFIPFEWRTDKYGRAEFAICPIYKRGKLVEMYIYPVQQPSAKEYWVWKGEANGYSFSSYEGLADPKVWMNQWCKVHKCNNVKLYVPSDAKFLYIDYSVGKIGINFTKTDWTRKIKTPPRSVRGA